LQIKIYGLASGKIQHFDVSHIDWDQSVLNFLIEKKIPIAYSCKGQFICKRCKINGGKVLACELKIKNIIEDYHSEISIDYI
jgi:ferredoxin